MISFASTFTNEEVQCIGLQSKKLAVKRIQTTNTLSTNVTLVTFDRAPPVFVYPLKALVKAPSTPDPEASAHLQLIYDCFCFYNCSFDAIVESCSSRSEYIATMQKVGQELWPLVSRYSVS